MITIDPVVYTPLKIFNNSTDLSRIFKLHQATKTENLVKYKRPYHCVLLCSKAQEHKRIGEKWISHYILLECNANCTTLKRTSMA